MARRGSGGLVVRFTGGGGGTVLALRDCRGGAYADVLGDAVLDGARLPEPLELAVELGVVQRVVEVDLAHLEERGCGEERV